MKPFDDFSVRLLIMIHRMSVIENDFEFCKKIAKDYFNVTDKEYNSWYLHFLKLYWKEVDRV